jgi:hypothetical protein
MNATALPPRGPRWFVAGDLDGLLGLGRGRTVGRG